MGFSYWLLIPIRGNEESYETPKGLTTFELLIPIRGNEYAVLKFLHIIKNSY